MMALTAAHEAAGATWMTVGDTAVPHAYARGFYYEHDAVRSAVGAIDLSYLAQFEVTGPDRNAFINRAVCSDVSLLATGGVQFTALLTDGGFFLDEVMLYRFDESLLLVVNAENAMGAWLHLLELKRLVGGNVRLRNVSDETVQFGVEGPRAADLVASLSSEAVLTMPFRTVRSARVAGVDVFVARSGYSGEDGFELFARARDALALWTALVEAGAVPYGHAARDLLRLEMGYVAWGREVDADVTPAEAGLGWIVALDKGARFVGEAALRAERRRGLVRRLVAVRTVEDGATLRDGDPVVARGRVVDRIRSSAFGPSVGATIALTYVPVAYAEPGMRVECAGPGGAVIPLVIVRRPFYAGGSRQRS
jgi:aminomethyltransferase